MDVTGRVRTGRCNLELFRGGSKFKVNIGIVHFWINSLRRARPQDMGVSNICRKRFSNIDRMQYVALITTSSLADVCWRYVRFQFDPEAVIAIIYLNSLNAGLNDDITHFLHWEYIAVTTGSPKSNVREISGFEQRPSMAYRAR